jgi:hypothetical protein
MERNNVGGVSETPARRIGSGLTAAGNRRPSGSVKNMSTPHGLFLMLIFCLPSPIFGQQTGLQMEAEGLIQLDVVVTNQAGKPVSGMEPGDFTLLDTTMVNQFTFEDYHMFRGESQMLSSSSKPIAAGSATTP